MSDLHPRVFEWDQAKNEVNFRKHGIRFEEACHVFDDPFAITRQDRIENGEERWQTIGALPNMSILLVAHTTVIADVEVIRIISVRKLSKKERYVYGHSQN